MGRAGKALVSLKAAAKAHAAGLGTQATATDVLHTRLATYCRTHWTLTGHSLDTHTRLTTNCRIPTS